MKNILSISIQSLQHSFAMLGASILIPIIMGVNVSTVLFFNGISTILYIYLSKKISPGYLGSSGVFLAPTLLIISKYSFAYALGAYVVVSFIIILLSFIIKKVGTDFIDYILPSSAMGPIVALIGLTLIPYAFQPGKVGIDITDSKQIFVFIVTLTISLLIMIFFKGVFSTLSILIGIICGCIVSYFLGMINLNFKDVSLFILPEFQAPKFALEPIIIMLPIIFIITSEHISHQVVTSSIINKDLLKDPGLDVTLKASMFATAISACFGSIPTTTYGENIALMSITKKYNYRIFVGAAIFSILFSILGPLNYIINNIPGAVIAGVTFLLYGLIASNGIRLLVDSKVDYNKTSNLIITSIVLVVGLSPLSLNIFSISLSGVSLATMVGIFVSLIFYFKEKLLNI